MKVLLDTDPGSDIDDALAIAYLLAHPECELLGITCVTGDTAKRSAIGRFVCREMGRADVPVLSGLQDVLLLGPGQPHVPHWEALPADARANLDPGSPLDAVLFLRDTIRRHPREVTLISIGPLTNLAVLFGLDPQIPELLSRTVSMVGVFDRNVRPREWNAECDPVATAIVMSRAKRHRVFGLDVTNRCRLAADEVRRRFTGSRFEFLLPMCEVFFRQASAITFHDILACAAVFRPELCSYRAGRVSVDLCDHPGATELLDQPGPQEAALGVDVDGFFDEFFSRARLP